MRGLELGAMALATFGTADALRAQQEQPNNGWPRKNVTDIANNNPFMKLNDYSAHPDTAKEFNPPLPADNTGISKLFPQRDHEVYFLPNTTKVTELLSTYPNTPLVRPDGDYSSVTMFYDSDKRIVNSTLLVHPPMEKAASSNGGDIETRVQVVQDFLGNSTGGKVPLGEAKIVYDKVLDCGAHATGNGSGNGYRTKFNDYDVTVGGGETPSDKLTFTPNLNALYGNCGITVSNKAQEPNSSPEPSATPNLPKSSASTWHIPNRWIATAGTAATALRFII